MSAIRRYRDGVPAFVRLPPGIPSVFSPLFAADPLPTLDWLRANAPVTFDPLTRMFLITSYADCEAALTHPGLSAAGGQSERTERTSMPVSMLNTDGEEHRRLRRPAMALLGPAAVRGFAVAISHELKEVCDAASRIPDGANVLTDLAEPWATAALAHVLSIVEPAARLDLGRHAAALAIALNPMPDPARAVRARNAMAEFDAFLEDLLDGASPSSPLAKLRDDPTLSRAETRGIASLAVVGGWSPLAEVLTTAVIAATAGPVMLDNPPDWVDELLRWHTPIPFVARRASTAVDLPGGQIPSGAMALVMIGAANRDPGRFTEPHSLGVSCPPGDHLAFGAGAHFCMGAPLVRGVVPAAIATLSRYDVTRLEGSGPPTFEPGVFPRRVSSIQVSLRPRHAN